MGDYVRETIYLLYLLWFKPLTFHRRFDVGGDDPLWLDRGLWRLVYRKERDKFLLLRQNRRSFWQIVVGNLLLLLVLSVLGNALVELWAWRFGIELDVLYGARVAFGVAVGVAFGVAVGVAGGVAGGVAFGVACLLYTSPSPRDA